MPNKPEVPWQEALERIEELLNNSKCEFAYETLWGIYDWVEAHERVTVGQLQAITNIEESKQ